MAKVGGIKAVLRLSFHDHSFQTALKISSDITAENVISLFCKKYRAEKLNPSDLVLCCEFQDDVEEQILESSTIIDEQMCALSQQNLMLFYVKPKSLLPTSDLPDQEEEESPDTDEELFGGRRGSKIARRGWLEKTGNFNPAWRRRYFVLDLENSKLFYYKKELHYKQKKKAHGFISLNSPSAAIRESTKRQNGPDFYHFEVVTPSRVYELRTPDWEDMQLWMCALYRKSVENEIFDVLSDIVSESEETHSESDMENSKTWRDMDFILSNPEGQTAFLRYLDDNRCAEYLYFVMDSERFQIAAVENPENLRRFAEEIYAKYIDLSGTHCLGELDFRLRKQVSQKIENNQVTKDLYQDIRKQMIKFLRRSKFNYFLKSEHHRSMMCNLFDSLDKLTWPLDINKRLFNRMAEPVPTYRKKRGKFNVNSPKYQGLRKANTICSGLRKANTNRDSYASPIRPSLKEAMKSEPHSYTSAPHLNTFLLSSNSVENISSSAPVRKKGGLFSLGIR